MMGGRGQGLWKWDYGACGTIVRGVYALAGMRKPSKWMDVMVNCVTRNCLLHVIARRKAVGYFPLPL